MQRIIEAFQRIVGPGEQIPNPFREAATRVMEESGGKEIILKVARELRENGDSSVIVRQERKRGDSPTDRFTLRWDLQERKERGSTKWESREVSIVAKNTGVLSIEASNPLLGDTQQLVSLSEIVDMENRFRALSRRYTPRLNLRNMSLEEQFRLAMTFAFHIPDFWHGEEEQSLKQKPVNSQFSKRIF